MLQLGMLVPQKKKQALVNCDLKTVPYRLAILLCLTIWQRDQTKKFVNLECLNVFDDRAILFIPDKLKTASLVITYLY